MKMTTLSVIAAGQATLHPRAENDDVYVLLDGHKYGRYILRHLCAEFYVVHPLWLTCSLATVGIEDYISWGFPFLTTIFRANDNNYVLYLAIYLGYL